MVIHSRVFSLMCTWGCYSRWKCHQRHCFSANDPTDTTTAPPHIHLAGFPSQHLSLILMSTLHLETAIQPEEEITSSCKVCFLPHLSPLLWFSFPLLLSLLVRPPAGWPLASSWWLQISPDWLSRSVAKAKNVFFFWTDAFRGNLSEQEICCRFSN